jgi:hypothetical protein
MPAKRSSGRRGSTTRNSRDGSKESGSSTRARGMSSAELEGRAPSGEPDVIVDIRKVKVDEIYVDVEHLDAHLALRAKLANLLQVVAGVHVHLGRVEVDIMGVEAEAQMKVRLENLYDILDRALTTLDRNPQILESLVHTVDDAVGDIGNLGQKAFGPGGAASQTLGDAGQAAQQAVQPGGTASQALGGLTDAAGQALGGEQAGDATQGLEQAAAGGQAGGAGAAAAAGQAGGDGANKSGAGQTKRGSKRRSARSSSKRSSTGGSASRSSRKRSATGSRSRGQKKSS